LGGSVSQCTFATEYRSANGWSGGDCCSYPFRDTTIPAGCNSGNWLFPEPLSSNGTLSELLLNNHSIATQSDCDSLSISQIYYEIDGISGTGGGRPFIIGWRGEGDTDGHVVVGRGVVGTPGGYDIYYMDPYPDTNNYRMNTYNWVANNIGTPYPDDNGTGVEYHRWDQTLRIDLIPQRPLPYIKVNGYDVSGPYYAASGQILTVTANLNAGAYTDAADWWVAGSFNGQIFYQNSGGNWVSVSPPPPRYQGTLQNISNFPIFSGTLSAGTYIIYFGVDLMQNGVIDDSSAYAAVLYIVVN
jgi:hypothetical protein